MMRTVVVVAVFMAARVLGADMLDLSGTWQHGRTRETIGTQTIRLPGSMQEQDLGDELSVDTPWTGSIIDKSWFTSPRYAPYRRAGHIKVPFWLQPKTHYIGEAWYRRDVEIPATWTGKRIVLRLERAHWETRVWIDDHDAGMRNSLSTPHEYDLTSWLTPGKHALTIRVDNRIKAIDVGPNSHSVSDHTQSNWNGLAGRIELVATADPWIDDVQIYPDMAAHAVRAVVRVGAIDKPAFKNTTLTVSVENHVRRMTVDAPGEQTVVLELGNDTQPWDEFSPTLHTMTAVIGNDRGEDRKDVRFGLREVRPVGTYIAINGRPTFLRGTLECAIFPNTGYPPTDVPEWKRIIGVCKAHGLNHIRFHSWCPPEAAFVAADELGFYYQVECASWANSGSSVGDGKPIDAWLYEEGARILKAYGNHPSFVMMAYGNEPGGKHQNRWLGDWVNHWKALDPRRLYTSGAGWPSIPENQYHVTPHPRIQHWGAGLRSRINAQPPETMTDYRDFVGKYTVPVVSHEIGQWCVYPNFDEIKKYTGVLHPENFKIFRDFLNAAGMGDQAHAFLMASGKLQTLCYKEEIESALRTPGFGGFELLDLHDFPGQGTALVGVLDPFWGSKPYVSPQEYHRFCAETVPLARMTKRVWTSDETFHASLDLAHYGPARIANASLDWVLRDDKDRTVGAGTLPCSAETGTLTTIGVIDQPLAGAACPSRLTLQATLRGTDFSDDWAIWVYPPATSTDAPAPAVPIIRELDDAAAARLAAGESLWLMADPNTIRTDVKLGFSSIFWNTAWTRGQAPHTLGILCDPNHPALADFPTEYHSNWQWWDIVSKAATMELDALPAGVKPIVQVVPDWFAPKRLALVFEAKVGKGKLLVSSIDLHTAAAERPVARQLHKSLTEYMAGDAFQPRVELSIEQVRALFKPVSRLRKMGATVSADSEQDGYEAGRACDGNPNTIWHTAWGDAERAFPHYLAIDFGSVQTVSGVSVLPRSDMSNGRIAKYRVELDGRTVASGTWADNANRKAITFDRPAQGRVLKLVAESEVRGRNWASVAEFEVIFP